MPLASPPETVLAYAAGIVDGEGCVRVTRQKLGMPVIRVQVTNTDMRLLAWFTENFGGYVWVNTRPHPGWKPCGVWELSARKCARFLSQIMPYVVLKKERAEIALAIQATYYSRGRTKIAPEVVNVRRDLTTRLTLLNKKGVA